MKKALLWALVIRLVFVPLAFHSDLNTNFIWGTYAKDFGLRGYYDWLNFGNYAKPEYPPMSTVMFLVLRFVYEALFAFFWKINTNIGIFPSKFIVWLDSFGYMSILKLPGIFADLGIGYLIFKLIPYNPGRPGSTGQAKKKKYAYYYLFNPAIIYLSALWGQTESVVAFLALAGLALVMRRKYLSGFWAFFSSFMIKASMLPIVPIVFIILLKDRVKIKTWIILGTFVYVGFFMLGFLFTDHSFIAWMINAYRNRFITGPHNLAFINLNAFNFWGLVLGFARISDKPYLAWAWGIAAIFFSFILYKLYKGGNIFFACLLIFFASFLFLPRMHERYLYPVFVFFPILLASFPKFKKVFYILSFVFLINLYHWWWVPNISPLVWFFDLELVSRGLSLVNIGCFGYLIWNYRLS